MDTDSASEKGRTQPSDGQFSPATEYRITTLETLKVISDPLRQQIIEALLDQPKTVRQIASELSLPPTKLYYHINLLDDHALIRVTETRIVSGIIEKTYRAAARAFSIDRQLLSPGSGGRAAIGAAMDALIEPLQSEIERGIESGIIQTNEDAIEARKLRFWTGLAHLTPERAGEFYTRLEALFDEFSADGLSNKTVGASPDSQAYRLIIGIYPHDTPHGT